jgi:peptide chain release factor 1
MEVDDMDTIKEGVVEVRAGSGGEEAQMFAKDLFSMYIGALQENNIHPQESASMSEFSIKFHDNSISRFLRFEAGVHRVQRVPRTEKHGRVHTSTASVAILPMNQVRSVLVDSKDLKFDSFRSSGPGGQNANMSNSAVRVTHIPTGIAVTSQEERSNSVNREKAVINLIEKLRSLEIEKEMLNITQLRKSQMKNSHRSDKIRTYNVCQNRVTDHFSNGDNYPLNIFMTGKHLFESMRKRRKDYLTEWLGVRGVK